MTSLFNLVGQGILGVIIGYLIKYLLDFKNSQKIEYANKKRKVYEELVQALNIFLSDRDITTEKKDSFLIAYSSIWLWAPDNIVQQVGLFVDHISSTDSSKLENQNKAKAIFGDIVILMRRDLGFLKTKLKNENYKFFSFK